jgi:hypothetical protein
MTFHTNIVITGTASKTRSGYGFPTDITRMIRQIGLMFHTKNIFL